MSGKIQHVHASRFHLERFAEQGQVLRVRRDGYTRHYAPTAVGYVEHELTDRDAPPSDQYWFEEVLALHEGRIAPIIAKALDAIEAGQRPTGGIDNRHPFTGYLAIQLCRSANHREWLTKVIERASIRDSLASARAESLGTIAAELELAFPLSCFFTCELPLALPELPFVCLPDGTGVMIAMTPTILFVKSEKPVALDFAGRFYWDALWLTKLKTPFSAVLGAPSDKASVKAEFCAS